MIKKPVCIWLSLILFTLIINLPIKKTNVKATPYQKPEEDRLAFDQAVFDTGTYNGGAFIQDRDGFLWIGTNGRGLIRYDGYEQKVYIPGGPNSISSPYIHSIFEDSEGILWIAAADGLNRYDKAKDKFTLYKNDPSDPKSISTTNWLVEYISVIDEDRNGTLWFGTTNGLNAFDRKSGEFTRYQHGPRNANSLAYNTVRSLIVDREGDLWIGMYGGGLDRLDISSGEFIHYPVDINDPKSLGSRQIIWLLEDNEGDIWIATTDRGLYMLDRDSNAFSHYTRDPGNPNSLASDKLYSLYQDSVGRIWIVYWSTEKAGLSILDKKSGIFTHYQNVPNEPTSLSTSLIDSVYEDRSGIIWVVHHSGIVDKLDPRKPKFKLYRYDPNDDNSLISSVVVSTYSDSNNILWIGQDTGLLSYDKQEEKFTVHLRERFYSAMVEDSSDTFWIGGCCNPNSLDVFDRQTGKIVKSYLSDPGNQDGMLNNGRISWLLEDRKNPAILWIGLGNNGFGNFDKQTNTFTHYKSVIQESNSLGTFIVMKLFQTSDGILWISASGAGLIRFDPINHTVRRYVHDDGDPNSIASDIVMVFYEDSKGTKWVGTSLGLDKFDESTGKFTHYTENTGYRMSSISSIVEDEFGHLWIGSHGGDGLIRFNPKTEMIKKYNESDGLQGDVFLPFNGSKDRDGEMWFGGPGGMNSFYPSSIKENTFIPPVMITSLTQGGEEMKLDKAFERAEEISLDWRHNYFEFGFVALNFTQAENNQYRYMLEGLEGQWFNAGTQRYGRYSGLPGGDYTLRIIASNNDGIWNEQGTSLRVRVIPPFWQTGWFYGLCALMIFGTVISVYYWRVSRLKEEKEAAQRFSKKLEDQVMARTSELAKANTSLAHAMEKVEVASRAKSEFLANMSHELRTPLNGILGYAQILSQGSTLTESQRNGLDIIKENGQHLLSLINDILDLSKIEAQKLELVYLPIRLDSFLQKIINLFQMRAQQKDLLFIYKANEQLPNGILADEKRLRQVLINLLSNAEKYTDRGEIMFQVNRLDEKETQKGAFIRLRFEVRDTGIGMTPEQLGRLFIPFEQFKASDQRREGAGLGLALSRRLVQAMGSDIKVESTIGVGSRFWFDVEFAEVAVDDLPLPLAHIPIGYQGPRRKILIADDKVINRKVLMDMLRPLDFELYEANDGRQAYEMATTLHPDLIIMDLLMPGVSGIDATQIIRKTPEIQDIPIIAVSASVFDQDQQQSLLVGCNAFLPKPIIEDQLFSLIEKILKIIWQYPTFSPMLEMTAEEPAIPSDVQLPSRKDLEELAGIAREGDVASILDMLDQIEKDDGSLAAFCTQIRTLARQFETERILVLLEGYRKHDG